LKHAFDRTRPCHTVADVHLLVGCSHSFSMPSSHAANTGAAAFHFMLFYPQLWSVLLLAALAVAYSRVYVGVHYPGDVMVGLLVGLVSALVVQAAYRWIRARRAASRPPEAAPAAPLGKHVEDRAAKEPLRSGS
jgi:undecaprenyl-diphosphatase